MLRRLFLRARATLRRGHDRELRDELRLHLQLLQEEYKAQGMTPEQAERRAHREFGNATLFQETSHDLFSFRALEDFVQDMRYAFREMRRSAAFTLIAVGSLAAGIGALTAAFAVIDAFMLRGLPVREPDRLVALSVANTAQWRRWPYTSFTHWRDSADALFDVAAASNPQSVDATAQDSREPASVRVSPVSTSYFQVLGADVILGRVFTTADDRVAGASPIAVISHAFWQRWFGGATGVVGKSLSLGGTTYEVVGVTRKGFSGDWIGHPTDVWVPLPANAGGTFRIIARLRDGAGAGQAAAAANVIHQRSIEERAGQLGANHPQVTRERQQVVTLLRAANGYAPEREVYARPLQILTGITALVLLVACANFTNLMLARSETRRKEFAVRLALGGGRWRLIRQSATECIVLAAVAGLLGLGMARWATTAALKQFAVMIQPVEFGLELDARVLGFAAACVALVIAFGVWPCTAPARHAALTSLSKIGGGRTRERKRAVASRVMLIGQLALCTVLLIGAGLLLRTVANLRSQELGFDRNVLLVSLAPGQAGYGGEPAAMLLQRIKERLLAIRGIEAVGMSGPGLLNYTHYWVDGSQQLSTDKGAVVAGVQWTSAAVGAGFFEAVGMSLVDGREFDEHDDTPPADVVVINRSLAKFLFGSENPLGRRIGMTPRGANQLIIGVVTDAKQVSPRDRGMGVVYVPLRGDLARVVMAVRTQGGAADAAPVVSHQLQSIAGDVPVAGVRTIEELVDEAIAQERLMSGVSSFLGALVILIGCVGLYALLSYDVAQRTHELGVRLALGATRITVVGMVLRDSAVLVATGLAAGVPLGIAASRPLASRLYGVRIDDPWTLGGAVFLLAGVAFIATFRPAQTASRIDPISLLRNE